MSKIKETEDFVGVVELPANSVTPPTLTHRFNSTLRWVYFRRTGKSLLDRAVSSNYSAFRLK